MKKITLAFILVLALTLTACGATSSSGGNSSESTVDGLRKELEETESILNKGKKELKVNSPIGEDNEYGGLYNVVVGEYGEVLDFLVDSVGDLYGSDSYYDYRSFIFVDKDCNTSAGFLYDNSPLVSEAIFSISDSLGIKPTAVVKMFDTNAGMELMAFNRECADLIEVDDNGNELGFTRCTLSSDWAERNNWIYDKLHNFHADENPMMIISSGDCYYVGKGMYNPDTGEFDFGKSATVSSELYSAGEVIIVIEQSVVKLMSK